jgi:hypothetical protein
MAPSAIFHILMFMQFSLVAVFGIVLMDMHSAGDESSSPSGNIKICYIWVSTIISLLLVMNWYILSNTAYLNMQMRHERTHSLATRILDRVEQEPDYTGTTPILVLGQINHDNYPAASRVARMFERELRGMVGTRGEFLPYSPRLWELFITDYLGRYMPHVDGEMQGLIRDSEEFKNMGNWPAEDSVKMINGVIVVKLSG